MDFELSEDQRAIAEMADGLFVDHCHDDYMRQWDVSGEPMMAPLWALCIETGLQALAIPEEHGGSGLGLAVSKSIISHMHGSIGYMPNKPQGSCFYIELPFDASIQPGQLP